MKSDTDFVKECDERHIAALKWRKQKAGNSRIKKWFYLGKDFENYTTTPYDKLAWFLFKRYCVKLEKKGVFLKRGWMKEPIRCRLYKDRRLFESPYRKFCSSWWKDLFSNIFKTPTYNRRVCPYDFFDLYENLIVNLTIKGLTFGLHGVAAKHKEQMHECWLIRNKVLKAYQQEDYAEWVATKAVENRFGINNYDVLGNDNKEVSEFYYTEYSQVLKDSDFSVEAFSELGKYINDLWD